jgi:hypothetical protein
MFYGDGRLKKVAEAISLWRDFTAYPQALAVTGMAAGSAALAAQDDKGARAILLANPSSTASSSAVSFSDGKTLADYALSISTVSDSASSAEPATALSGSRLSVPANATVLVRLTPKANVFAASAQASGAASALNLSVNATMAATDVGKRGSIYVLALAGSNWFAFNGAAWALWSGGTVPESFVGNLPPSYSARPFTGVDVRAASGIPVFVGYGTSLAEMISSARFKEVYRTP